MIRSFIEACRRAVPAEFVTLRGLLGVSKTTIVTANIDLPSVANGARGSVDVTVPGVKATSHVVPSFRTALPAGVAIVGWHVKAVNTVTVFSYNYTGAPVDAAAITTDWLITGE